MDIEARLFELQDEKYRNFQSKLVPTVDKNKIIGVRAPLLRKLAKEIYYESNYCDFMGNLPHKYFEEDNIHAFLIEKISDYNECICELNKFLPYVDNWATCDSMSPKILKNNTADLIEQIKIWLRSEHTYTVRFAIKTLMSFYSQDNFLEEHLELVASVSSQEYYIKMAMAWYYATVMVNNYKTTVAFLKNGRLDKWTHNKAIQKAIESYRISDEQKVYLKSIKR